MNETVLNNELNILVNEYSNLYKINKPSLMVDKVYGNKLGYYSHAKNQIVIDEHYAENADQAMQKMQIKPK